MTIRRLIVPTVAAVIAMHSPQVNAQSAFPAPLPSQAASSPFPAPLPNQSSSPAVAEPSPFPPVSEAEYDEYL